MGPLRGRGTERAILDQLVSGAVAGAGGIAVVEGAAGIGKSRLLAEAAERAAAAGLQVVAGVSDELDQVTPWAPLLRAIGSTSPALLSDADLAPLRTLVDQRLMMIEFIRTALERASSRRPLLISLDDLQWADPATLLTLGTLPIQLFSYPVAWILAQRPLPTSTALQSLAARLAEAGAARLHLGPLDPDAAAELATDVLGADPGPGVAKQLARAEGNPLYITEVLRGAAAVTGTPAATNSAVASARGTPARPPVAPGTLQPVPASLRSAVAAHLRSLPEPACDLLKVASVLGSEFTVAELAAVSGQPASQLMPALSQALLAETLTERKDRLAFRHDLFRQAVYQDLPASLRQALHRDAAAALRRSGAPLVRVAGQFAAGAQPGDEEAVEVLTAAVWDLFATSPSAAADLALRVLDLLGAADLRRAGATVKAVGMLGWASRLDEARDLGEGYLATHDPPPVVAAEIEMGMRRPWGMSTSLPYPRPLPARLVTDPQVPAPTRAQLIAQDQVGLLWNQSPAITERALRQATELVADDKETGLAEVLAIRTALAHHQGQVTLAFDTAMGGRDPAARPQSDLAAVIHDSTIASCEAALGQPGAALRNVGQALRAASDMGVTFIVSRCLSLRSLCLLELGRVQDALAEGRAAAKLTEDLSFYYYLGQAMASLVEASIRQGEVAEARAAAERLAPVLSPDVQPGDQYWAAALCADATGRPDQALAALAPVLDRLAAGQLLFAAWYPSRLPQIADLAMRAGAEEQAALAARVAALIAERNPGITPLLAAAAHARGLWQADTGALREAVELSATGERPLATAAAREDLGRALVGDGAKSDAVACLEAAYETYVATGASRDAARVRSALHALGVRKRQASVARPDRGWASLTNGELAVVRVVAEGLTSREAAAQLYLSADTVNTHLRHAFTKLGIRSRVELARLVLSQPEHL